MNDHPSSSIAMQQAMAALGMQRLNDDYANNTLAKDGQVAAQTSLWTIALLIDKHGMLG